jgi:hypothetical protein
MPVAGGAGKIRMETGTPLCKPRPLICTGRWTVVSYRTVCVTSPKPVLVALAYYSSRTALL